MQNANSNITLLRNAPIPQALLILGVPIMIGMLINALYNLVDAYFISGLGEVPTGAIAIVFPLGQIIIGLGLMFGSGAASLLSRLLGQGEKTAADRVASTALYGSIFLGIIAILLMQIFLQPLLIIFGATETLLPDALLYARIYLWAAIFNIFNVTMNNIVSSEGAAKTAMGALLAGAIANIFLDPLCIYGLRLGIIGAAVASAIGQLITTIMYLRYIRRGRSLFSFSCKAIAPSRSMLWEILQIGGSTLIFQLLTSLAMALTERAAGIYGDGAIAALGIVMRIMTMATLVVFGFLKGMQPLAGFSYGAKNFARLRAVTKTAILWSTLFCTTAGLSLAIFARPIMQQFAAGSEDILHIGEIALRANGIAFCVFGFCTVYATLFLALGKSGIGLFLGACRQGICFLPVILLLPKYQGLSGILYAQPIADGMTAMIAIVLAWHWHHRSAQEENLFLDQQ